MPLDIGIYLQYVRSAGDINKWEQTLRRFGGSGDSYYDILAQKI
jgi:hypothetical protein